MKTADLCDQYSDRIEICRMEFKSFGRKKRFSGPIATVEVFEDNVLVRKMLETIPEGSVLVVNGHGSRNCALVGDMLAQIAVDRKLAGIIVNGCIRDSGEIDQMDVGIFAIGTMPLKSKKEGKGKTNEPTTFGGITWVPGDYAYADEDGVIVSSEPLTL
ncbi:ribonuclease E activity regulator RraA [Calidifontibacillus erzurumensis]|uniref:4-hydroxy-4-methyl-2-oxoglutarate aldolase n=1 Tax=Calidifontibacillus erzurumensis TaxID=2741433 RepID=A0A8J8GD92_9BACI|nr:ribonuclease E activity regulator RraA [Calidifontibacillus erzurumensis]NSL51026.1 ribonuclease E activity regulator RraA [Calidifontibacillus erzurumensis]